MQPPIVDAAGMQNTTTVLIGGLLSEYYIEVPEFQRGYSWEEQELIEFWDDLNEIFTREKSHYFGLIVAESNAEAIPCQGSPARQGLIVIDGQQRLTTSVLFIKAIQLLADEIPDGIDDQIRESLKQDCENKLRFTPAGALQQGIPTWTHVINNKRAEFNASIHALLDDNNNHNFNSGSEKRMKNALNVLKSKLKSVFQENESLANLNYLKDIHDRFSHKFTTVKVTLPDDMEAPAVFEVMNNRGRPLSTLDLLKNLIMLIQLRINPHLQEMGMNAINFEETWFQIVSLLDKYGLSSIDQEKKLLALYWQLFKGKGRVEENVAYEKINAEFKILLKGFTNEQIRDWDHLEDDDSKNALEELNLFISRFYRVTMAFCEYFTKDVTTGPEDEQRSLFGGYRELFATPTGDNAENYRLDAKKYLSDIRSMDQVGSMQSTIIACMDKAENVKEISKILKEAEKTLYRTYRIGRNTQRYNYQEDPRFSHKIFRDQLEKVTLKLDKAVPEETYESVKNTLLAGTIPAEFPREATLYEAMIGYFWRVLSRANTALTLRSFKESLMGELGKTAANSHWVRYFFFKYNRSIGGIEGTLVESFKKGIFGDKDVEHIMPQSVLKNKNKKYWITNQTNGFSRFEVDLESENHPEQRIHDLGNIVLTRSETNRKVYRDRQYITKRPGIDGIPIGTKKILYSDPNVIVHPPSSDAPEGGYQDYAMVRDIPTQYKDWRWQCIEDRKKRLINWALGEWQLDCNLDIMPPLIPLTKLYWHENAIRDMEDPRFGHKAIQAQRVRRNLEEKINIRDSFEINNEQDEQELEELNTQINDLENRLNYRNSISEANSKKFEAHLLGITINSLELKRQTILQMRGEYTDEKMQNIDEHVDERTQDVTEIETQFGEHRTLLINLEEAEGENEEENTLEIAHRQLEEIKIELDIATLNKARALHLKKEFEKLSKMESEITESHILSERIREIELKIGSCETANTAIETARAAGIVVPNHERLTRENTEAIDSLRGYLNEIVERLEAAHTQQEEPNELVDGAVEPVNNQPPVVEEE